MDIKDSILSIPYGEIKQYVDTRIQFNALLSDKKDRTILDEINSKLDKKQDALETGTNITINENTISAEGYVYNPTIGSFVEGDRDIVYSGTTYSKPTATGIMAHAEGSGTIASGDDSHAEGSHTIASSKGSHAEGCGLDLNEIYPFVCSVVGTEEQDAIKAETGITFTYCNHSDDIPDEYGSQGYIYSDAACTQLISEISICVYYQISNYRGDYFNIKSGSLSDSVTYYWKRVCGATNYYSHAEGNRTTASGHYSHAEGENTTASGIVSHAEGESTIAQGWGAHAEGSSTTASGVNAHAEGYYAIASGEGSHAEGNSTAAIGNYSHSEGSNTKATENSSHAEGDSTTASGTHSHAEGSGTIASGGQSHAEGGSTTASGSQSHAEGYRTIASNSGSHAEGYYTIASGKDSHAEGYGTLTQLSNISSRTATTITFSSLPYGIKIGSIIKDANEAYAKVTNINTSTKVVTVGSNLSTTRDLYYVRGIAYENYSHAEGSCTIASGEGSHAEGLNTIASGNGSHAEGLDTTASGDRSHSEGCDSTASGFYSHAEGYGTNASGACSHAEGYNTNTQNYVEHAQGSYNNSHKTSSSAASTWQGNGSHTLHSIGIGTANNARKNAVEVMQNGDAYLFGVGNYDGVHIKGETGAPSGLQTLQETISGKQDKTIIINNTTGSTVSMAIEPNKMYMFGEKTSITITGLIAGTSGIVNEYMFQFTSGNTATTLIVPNTVVWLKDPDIQANKKYAVSIENNLGIIGEWNNE